LYAEEEEKSSKGRLSKGSNFGHLYFGPDFRASIGGQNGQQRVAETRYEYDTTILYIGILYAFLVVQCS
jgi:hypothetical protein